MSKRWPNKAEAKDIIHDKDRRIAKLEAKVAELEAFVDDIIAMNSEQGITEHRFAARVLAMAEGLKEQGE